METLYEKSSLILNPGVYDTGKVYCTKPFDGSGDLTFTRNSNATRVNADGLVEKVRTNEARYSEDQTAWTDQNETSVTANTAANPLNGAVTADKVVPSTLTADHYRGRAMATMVGEFTASIYVKADGYNFIDFGVYNTTAFVYVARATFDLSTATYSLTSGTSASITSVGSGWYRVSMLASVSFSSALSIYHRVRPTGATGNYSGDGTSGALFWGCQLENGVETDYIGPTTSAAVSVGPTANVPRLDYSGGACPSLLLEPQRTNLLTYSEQFSNINWLKAGVNITSNTSQTLDPSGYYGADKLVEDSSNGSHVVYAAITGTSGTFSFFAKAAERSWISVLTNDGNRAYFNLSNGTIGAVAGGSTASITPYANGWYRCTVYNTHPTYGASIYLSTGNGITSYQGDGTSGAYIWGAQLEAGSYATSYIPTLGASVTRLADFSEVTFADNTIAPTANTTVFYEVQLTGLLDESPNTGGFNLKNQAGTNNRLNFNYGYGRIYSNYVSGGTSAFYDANAGDTIKVAFQLTNGGKSFVNGVHTHTTTRDWSTDTFGNPEFSFGHLVKQYIIFDSVLSDAECITLTTL